MAGPVDIRPGVLGNLPINNLGSGQNASAASFWAGDGTWRVALNDTTAVPGQPGSFWTSVPGSTAVISRVNRLFAGEATVSSGAQHPTPPNEDWMEALVGGSTSFGQIASVSTLGLIGVIGGTRTSDFRTAFGGAAGNALAVVGFGYNDDLVAAGTPGDEPIAQGGYFPTIRKSGAKGITSSIQCDPNNSGSSVLIDPFTSVPSGCTIGLLHTPGSLTPYATQNPSAAEVISTASVPYNAGIVVQNNSVAASGPSSTVPAIALPVGYHILWYSSTGVLAGALTVNSSGDMRIDITGSVKINGTTLTVP